MENGAEERVSGFGAAKKHIPSLFSYLRRYRRGLLFGVICVVVTAATANVVPYLVNRTLKHISSEGNTVRERVPYFYVEALWAHSIQVLPILPLVWDAQEEVLSPIFLAPKRESSRLPFYFFAILAMALFSAVFRFLQRWVLIGISRKVEFDLRNDLFQHLLRMPPSFFGRMTTGDIVARATNDLNQVRSMLGPGLMYPINAICTMAFALVGMVYLSPPLAIIAIAPPLIMAIGTNRFSKVLHDRFTLVQEQYSQISSKVQENLSGIRVVKAYVREDAEIESLRDLNREYLSRNLKYFRSIGMLYPFFGFSHNLGQFVVLTLGCYFMISPQIRFDEGDFLAFLLYLNLMQFPMISIGWVLNVIQRGVASLVRINEIMEEEPDIKDPEQPIVLTGRPEGRLVFRNVWFGYDPDRPVLKGVDLEIPAGRVLGIVGGTGSGKSTLAQLIPRFYDPNQGEILLDDRSLTQYRLADLRGTIGLVAQDHFMFSTTVAKNITFGLDSEEIFQETIEEASRLAALHENVIEFPEGYETLVGERGVTLSGGQRQRAAIARALAINPKILILDDALSAVDTQTEERILTSLRSVLRERTTLLISHRISTMMNADWIVVLENGRIAESGTHETLVAAGGFYAALFRRQQLEKQIEEMSA